MRIAVPVWNDCVSSVFDFAHRIAIVDARGKQEIGRSQIELQAQPMQQRVQELLRLGVHVLICGAISQPLAAMLVGSNIEVIPFVSGTLDGVLDAYLHGRLSEPQFLQPGCRPGARRRFGCVRARRRRGRRGRMSR